MGGLHPVFHDIFNSYEADLKRLQDDAAEETARRKRLLRFIWKFYEGSNTAGRALAFNGYGRRGIIITPDNLSDETLEKFAQQLRADFWSTKKRNRANRAIYARLHQEEESR